MAKRDVNEFMPDAESVPVKRGRPPLTNWFPAGINPVRPGPYETKIGSCILEDKRKYKVIRNRWNGQRWLDAPVLPMFGDEWRGIRR